MNGLTSNEEQTFSHTIKGEQVSLDLSTSDHQPLTSSFCSCILQLILCSSYLLPPTRNNGLSSNLLCLEGYYGLIEKTGEQGVCRRHRDEEDEREKHTDLVPETATFNGSAFDSP